MTTLQAHTYIEAPVEKVWKVLSDIGAGVHWSPNLSASPVTSAIKSGVGTERKCDLVGGGFIRDRVIHWDEGKHIAWEVYENAFPMKSGFEVRLVPYGPGTFFEFEVTYELLPEAANMGIPAEMIEAGTQQNARNAVYGMKQFVEKGIKPPQVPLPAA